MIDACDTHMHCYDGRFPVAPEALSAPYVSSTEGPPDYRDAHQLIEALVARTPDRLLWATNWPHPGQAEPPTPAELLTQVLVTNPTGLYGF